MKTNQTTRLTSALFAGLFSCCFLLHTELSAASAETNSPSLTTQDQNSKKIKRKFNQLKKTKGPDARINALVNSLVRLDPKKATRYYATALQKFTGLPEVLNRNIIRTANAIERRLTAAKNQNQLTNAQRKRIAARINMQKERALRQIVPTPTPYQA